ncbi:NAD(P)-binding protein [Xylariaceae sp. FL1651]|nr:NAD(P)-binding protein [Xylariaceae sp. FL1651]
MDTTTFDGALPYLEALGSPPEWAATLLLYTGVIALLTLVYKLFNHVTFYLLPAMSLDKYRRGDKSWALVTGGSAGIGLATAQELAARGFDIIILGHLPQELEEAARLIQAHAPGTEVKIIVLDAVTATPEQIEEALAETLTLPLTILVNNVAVSPVTFPGIRNLAEYTAADLDRQIFANARFMAHVSRILLPNLAVYGPSLVLNLSSAAKMGVPGIAPYAGCKAFILSLTKAMAREMWATNQPVDCLTVVPGDVKTPSNHIGLQPGYPDANQFAKAMLDRAPRAVARGWHDFHPWWSHSATFHLVDLLPRAILEQSLLATFEKKRQLVLKAHKQI